MRWYDAPCRAVILRHRILLLNFSPGVLQCHSPNTQHIPTPAQSISSSDQEDLFRTAREFPQYGSKRPFSQAQRAFSQICSRAMPESQSGSFSKLCARVETNLVGLQAVHLAPLKVWLTADSIELRLIYSVHHFARVKFTFGRLGTDV